MLLIFSWLVLSVLIPAAVADPIKNSSSGIQAESMFILHMSYDLIKFLTVKMNEPSALFTLAVEAYAGGRM